MHKIIRSLTVIGSAVALTLAGTTAASAQTSISDISSQLFPGGMPGPGGGPVVNVEQRLHNAAEGWAQRGTGKSVALSNTQARNANPTGAWMGLVSGAEFIYQNAVYGPGTGNYFLRVDKNNYSPIVDYLNTRSSGHAGKNYGVHVHSDANYYYVNVAFTN